MASAPSENDSEVRNITSSTAPRVRAAPSIAETIGHYFAGTADIPISVNFWMRLFSGLSGVTSVT